MTDQKHGRDSVSLYGGKTGAERKARKHNDLVATIDTCVTDDRQTVDVTLR